jgi:hypothetical protein
VLIITDEWPGCVSRQRRLARACKARERSASVTADSGNKGQQLQAQAERLRG